LKERFGSKCFNTIINTCTLIRESASRGMPIDAYNNHSAGFRDYQSLTKEVIKATPVKVETVAPPVFPMTDHQGPTQLGEREIVFTLEAPRDAAVQIAGDFNNWVPQRLDLAEFHGRPVWRRTVQLTPGTYQYKYLVGGQWIQDPANERTTDDFFGGVNSVVHV
jgi:hypothetical protein